MSLVIVDSVKAWRVTVGCFIINGLMVGIMKVFSLIIIEYQDVLDAEMSLLLLGISMMTSLIGIASPLATFLSEKMTTRKLGILSALMSTCSLVALASAYHIAVYIISTIMLGFSFSMIYIPTFSIPGKCHIVHQTLSQGIVTSGASVGTLLMPLALAQVIDIYSIRGYVLILAALILHFAVGAILMPKYIVSLANPKKPKFIMCQEQYSYNHKGIKKLGYLKIYGYSSSSKSNIICPPRPLLVPLCLYAIGMGLTMNGYMLLSGLYGAFARSFDLDITISAYILIGHSCLDFLSRLVIGFIVDFKICERYLLYSVSAILLSIDTILTSLVPILALFYLYIIVNAILGSILMVLQILVLSDLVGTTYLSSSFAIYTFVQGGMAMVTYYAVGKVCDVTENYNYGICIAGVMILLGAFLILIEFCIRKKREK